MNLKNNFQEETEPEKMDLADDFKLDDNEIGDDEVNEEETGDDNQDEDVNQQDDDEENEPQMKEEDDVGEPTKDADDKDNEQNEQQTPENENDGDQMDDKDKIVMDDEEEQPGLHPQEDKLGKRLWPYKWPPETLYLRCDRLVPMNKKRSSLTFSSTNLGQEFIIDCKILVACTFLCYIRFYSAIVFS